MARFGRVLALIVLLGCAVRVGYVLVVVGDEPLQGDQIFYTGTANRLAQGHGFVYPYDEARNELRVGTIPAADHPPLTVLVLAPVAWLLDHVPGADVDTRRGNNHAFAFRLTFAVLGSVTVLLVGLLGREVAGDRVGLIAAGIAALYPNLWVNDGLVMAETLTLIFTALILLLVYRYRRAPTAPMAIAIGVACGLAALTRSEMILFAPCIALPVLLASPVRTGRERVGRVGVASLALVVVVAPWVTFNLTRFEEPTFLSTNDGQTLLGANCPDAYSGAAVGMWLLDCLQALPGDQSQVSSESRRLAVEFMRENRDRLPAVVAIRVARLWNVYAADRMVSYNAGEGRLPWISRVGLWSFYPLALLAVAGVYALRRAWSKLWPLLTVVVLVSVVAAVTYGQMRLRVPAEVSVVVLAAVAIDAIARKLSSSIGRPTGPGHYAEAARSREGAATGVGS